MLKRSLISLCLVLSLAGLASATDVVMVQIRELQIEPSQILTAQEIAEVKLKFEGTTLPAHGLDAITFELDGLYATKGYIAKAVLPAQTIENGVVQVQLVEGRVGAIQVEGNAHTKDSFYQRRLTMSSGDLVSIDQLDHDITYINRTNDVQIRAELAPGQAFGTTDVVVIAQEPVNNRYVFAVDNWGRADTGLYRTTVSWQNLSVLGHRDPMTLTGVFANGTQSGSVSYNYPITSGGVRLGITYGVNEIVFQEGTYAPVGLKVDSQSGSVSLSAPLHVLPQFTVLGSLEWHHRKSDTYLSGARLTGSEAGAGVVSLTIDAALPAGKLTFAQGVRIGESQIPNRKGEWYKYTANLSVVQQTRSGAVWQLSGAGQLTVNDLLPSDEQFTIGGGSSVRGYQEGQINGDRGYTLSLEYHKALSERWEGYAFVDHGGVIPYKGNDEKQGPDEYLTSVGIGAKVRILETFTAHMHYGVPVGMKPEDGKIHLRIESVW